MIKFIMHLFGYIKPCRPNCYTFVEIYDGQFTVAECKSCGARHEVIK